MNRSSAISICFVALRNTSYGKPYTSWTLSVTPLCSLPYLEESLYSRVWLTDRFDAFFTQENISDTNGTNMYNSSNLKNVLLIVLTDRCYLTLNFGDSANHSHPERLQPLTDRKVKHKRRNVVLRVRGCRMAKRRHSFKVCKHEKLYLFYWTTRS